MNARTGPGAPLSAPRAITAADERAAVIAYVVAHSDALLHTGDVETLREAAERVAPGAGPLPAALAWRWGLVLHQSGHFVEAEAVCGRVEPLLEAPGVPSDDAEVDRAHLAAVLASSLWAQGDAVGSREAADAALGAATRCRDDSALTRAWVAQALVSALEGDRHGNTAAYEKALTAAVRAGDVLSMVRIHNNLGSLASEEGRYAAALVHLDEALALFDAELAAPVRALSHINRAEALLGLGRVDEALAELHAGTDLSRASGSPLLAFAVLGLGEANRLRGNASQAAAAYREAIEIADRAHDAQALVSATAGLALALVVDDVEEASTLVERALAQPAALGQVEPLLAAGWIRLAGGDREAADDFARRAVREAGRRHEPRGLAQALELQALLATGPRARDLLDEAATLWSGMGNTIGSATNAVLRARTDGDPALERSARARLRALGVRDDATRIAGPLAALSRTVGSRVEVRALGTFVVRRDGSPVPASAWQSRKSRDALKILAGRLGRPVTREALAEHLWPGDAAATGNRLSVVLSTLRGVLDPDRSHPSDFFVVADRQSVRLDPETVEMDTVVFAEAAREALHALRAGEPHAVEALERAAAAYTGHFLDDDPYSDWAAGVRDELLGLVTDVRRELAGVLLETGEPRRAIPWLVGLLADDPFDEPSWQALIGALAGTRRHGEARRAYRGYAARMAELGAATTPWDELAGSTTHC